MLDPGITTSQARYFDPINRRCTEQPLPDSVPVPALDGSLSTADAALARAAGDYGRSAHFRPLAVARPGSPDDIAGVLRFATTHHIPVIPRTEGHSTAGQAQAPAGIVLDMRGLHAVHEITEEHVVVDDGAHWSTVVEATLPHGLAPPVLTDYLEMSVGGTLSVGGISGAGHRFGARTDNVLCSPCSAPHPRTTPRNCTG